MSRRDDNGPRLLVCVVCQRPEDGPRRMDAPRSGTTLLDALTALAAGDPRLAELSIEPVPCIFNCQRDCSVHARAPGKPAYILERLGTDAESARAVLDFCLAHMESPDGVVTEANQPEAVLGHVVEAVPPPRYFA